MTKTGILKNGLKWGMRVECNHNSFVQARKLENIYSELTDSG